MHAGGSLCDRTSARSFGSPAVAPRSLVPHLLNIDSRLKVSGWIQLWRSHSFDF